MTIIRLLLQSRGWFVAYHSRSVTLRRRSIEASAIEGTVDDSEGTAGSQPESGGLGGTASSRGKRESPAGGRAGNTTQHVAVGGLQGSVPEHCGIFPTNSREQSEVVHGGIKGGN